MRSIEERGGEDDGLTELGRRELASNELIAKHIDERLELGIALIAFRG